MDTRSIKKKKKIRKLLLDLLDSQLLVIQDLQ